MELTDYIRVARKSWWLILAATVLGLAVAGVFSLTRAPIYQAQSTVFVSTQSSGTVQELQQGSSFTQARVTTYVNLVTTPIVMTPVIDDLDLDETPTTLAESVDASSPLNTTLIDIVVDDRDPQQAADIANALGASLTVAVASLETPEGQAVSPVKLTRVKDASPGLAPVSPNIPLNLALGLLVGLVVGTGIAVLRSIFDNKVRTPRDVEAITDRPLIGAIPFDPRARERPIIVQADPQNPRSEAFRSLRTNLQFLELDGGHTFVVTSSVPSEGKSTTALNLAIALADAGNRVALIDTDLRRPKVAEYLGIEGGAGLTDVLIGRVAITDVLLPWGGRSLWVLPSGYIPPNPSELLGSQRMSELLTTLSGEFDIVLCDAPPLLPVTDAAVLSRLTAGAIIVIAAGRATVQQVGGALEALQAAGSKVAGTVLSMVPTRGADAYGYGRGYGYSGGYGPAHTSAEPAAAVPARPVEATSGADAPISRSRRTRSASRGSEA